MDEGKRKSIFDQSSEKKLKSIPNKSITCIENLSNEIFYEIFDYLEGCEIIHAFANLNYQIQEIFNCSSLLYRIKLYSYNNQEFLNKYSQFLFIKKHQILSIDILFPTKYYKFFSSIITDPSFDRLESMIIQKIQSNILISLLKNLIHLPRLFALTIDSSNTGGDDVNIIYSLLFALPILKYLNFNISSYDQLITFPTQFSSIEHLVIKHSCVFNEFLSLISYTPHLRRLTLHGTRKNDVGIKTITPIIASKFREINMILSDTTFYEFETFISKLFPNLQSLSITVLKNISFLNSIRWEELILQSFPNLKKFHLTFFEHIKNHLEYSLLNGETNQFSSSLWFEKKWIFEANVNQEYIKYQICPYKKRWYDDYVINSSLQLSESSRLILTYYPNSSYEEEIITSMIRGTLILTKIYHLEILQEKISVDFLIQILKFLPDLCTLKFHSLTNISEQEFNSLEKNKILKIYLEEINDIQELNWILKFYFYMTDLKLGCINNLDIQLFLHTILQTIHDNHHDYLRSICFHIPTADDQLVEKLKDIIQSEKLFIHFNIKRVSDNIYLKWSDFSSFFSHE